MRIAKLAPKSESLVNPGRLKRYVTGVFEEMGRHRSEDKPANMCKVSHAAGLYLRDGAGMHELHEKPDTDQERRRDERDPYKNEDKKNCFNPIPRVGHNECAHNCCDRPTSTQVGN